MSPSTLSSARSPQRIRPTLQRTAANPQRTISSTSHVESFPQRKVCSTLSPCRHTWSRPCSASHDTAATEQKGLDEAELAGGVEELRLGLLPEPVDAKPESRDGFGGEDSLLGLHQSVAAILGQPTELHLPTARVDQPVFPHPLRLIVDDLLDPVASATVRRDDLDHDIRCAV